jgi:3-hydroxyisobutyrate dehydrogenase-like beta-hydroxyacid dehydrogenase
MSAIQIAGIAEGLAIAEQAGLDMKLVLEEIETGVAASPQVIRHSKRMAARNFAGATFTAALRHKDAAYAVALAEQLLPISTLMGRAAVESYARARAVAPDDDEARMIEIVSRPRARLANWPRLFQRSATPQTSL